mmetsp:Transcript_59751/g.156695  ORF Transcript_59751/g.156695 Transcript_59751/m.156695 type:complete len:208 (-) Transcript_59751:91-714(-)
MPEQIGNDDDEMSVATVCKEYFNKAVDAPTHGDLLGVQKPLDFTSFLLEAEIGFIVRTNFDKEPGMPKTGSYQAAEFMQFGLGHADIPVVDTEGGLPRRTDVAKLLQVCPGLGLQKEGGGVVVHCKGGFGRSVVLACCLAIDRFDLPGAALLGWARVVRPGAINTPEQELFLQSFAGRADMRKFAGLTANGDPSPPTTCGPYGCSLQ